MKKSNFFTEYNRLKRNQCLSTILVAVFDVNNLKFKTTCLEKLKHWPREHRRFRRQFMSYRRFKFKRNKLWLSENPTFQNFNRL